MTKTDLVGTNASIMYRTNTELHAHLMKHKTTITRLNPKDTSDSQPPPFAEIIWHNLEDDNIVYLGHQHKAQSFLPHHGLVVGCVLSDLSRGK